MAKKVGFLKSVKLFFIYRKLIKNNYDSIHNKKHNLRVDYVNRIYTVVNLPDDVKKYGNKLAQKYISEYINDVDKLFLEIGISEYVGILDIKQEDELDYVIVFGFKFFNTAKMANKILLIILSIPLIWLIIMQMFY